MKLIKVIGGFIQSTKEIEVNFAGFTDTHNYVYKTSDNFQEGTFPNDSSICLIKGTSKECNNYIKENLLQS
jgi:hypothetical protein